MRLNLQKGISALEVIIVIVILVLLISVTLAKFKDLRESQALQVATTEIVSVLKKANSQTLASIDSSEYGVHFSTNAVIIFKGTSYPSGSDETTAIDDPAYISAITLAGGGDDVYFNRLSGVPSTTGTVTVAVSGATKTITIGATGIISVD